MARFDDEGSELETDIDGGGGITVLVVSPLLVLEA